MPLAKMSEDEFSNIRRKIETGFSIIEACGYSENKRFQYLRKKKKKEKGFSTKKKTVVPPPQKTAEPIFFEAEPCAQQGTQPPIPKEYPKITIPKPKGEVPTIQEIIDLVRIQVYNLLATSPNVAVIDAAIKLGREEFKDWKPENKNKKYTPEEYKAVILELFGGTKNAQDFVEKGGTTFKILRRETENGNVAAN